LLDEFERSGGSGAQFAAYVGVKYSTFANWVAKRRQRRPLEMGKGPPEQSRKGPGTEAMRWWETVVEAQGKASNAVGVLQVHLPGGVHLQIADASQADLAAVLLEKLGRLGAKGC
jgi:hypothetical protein